MREHFASKTNSVYSSTRAWISQKSDEISDQESTGWGHYGKDTAFGFNGNGYLRLRVVNAQQAQMMSRVDTIIPQFGGTDVKLKNFKMTVNYYTALPDYRGAITVGFDEDTAGYNVMVSNPYKRTVTGSMLVLGNGTGNDTAVGTDGWVFYDKSKTTTISGTTVDSQVNSTVASSEVALTDGVRFDDANSSQNMTLTVEVRNGKAKFTLDRADGTTETMEKDYTAVGGYVSIGMSNRDYAISNVEIVEYDDEGNAVDFGTYHNNAVEMFHADFADLPDAHYVSGKYLYNTNHDSSTGYGVGLTAQDSASTVTSVGAFTSDTTYAVNVNDTAMVDYLESKFDFFVYANGGGGTMERWNAAGYFVDADGNNLSSGWKSGGTQGYDPATGNTGGDYMPGSGQGGYSYLYPTVRVSSNKWLRLMGDWNANAATPFDVVSYFKVKNADGSDAVLKNFRLDLDFKLTTASATTYPQNQSPVFVKFGGYEGVTKGCTDGAMFAVSYDGGYFLDDLNTVVNGSTFTATQASNRAPYYTENAGVSIGEAHLTLTVKNGTVNAKITNASGDTVLDVTKNDINIQSGTIQIGTTYAGIYHGMPYFGAVDITRLDTNGYPIDFDAEEDDAFEGTFVGLTDYRGGKYYRNNGNKDDAITEGKIAAADGVITGAWLSNETSGQFAFGAEDTTIVEYLSEKFDFYHTDLTGKTHKMETPYTGSEELQTDKWAAGNAHWELHGGRWMRAFFGVANTGGELFRKQMTVVPKQNGEAIYSADFKAEFDLHQHSAFNDLTNGTYGGGAIAFTFGSNTIAEMVDSGDKTFSEAVTLVFTRQEMAIYDGEAADFSWQDLLASDNRIAWSGDASVSEAHVSVEVKEGNMNLTVTSLDGSITYYTVENKALNHTEAGHMYFTMLNSDGALADVEIESVPAWIKGLPTYGKGYSGVNTGYFGTKTFVIEGTNADAYNAYLDSVEAAGWTKVSENTAADNLFTTYQKDGQSVYMYYLAAENRVHVVEMEANAVLPEAEAEYTKVCEPLFTQVQLSYATASEGMSYLVRLSDGRFIVIDGGMTEADYLETKHLYNLMEEQNVLDKVTVAAWIITHAHADHEAVPVEFLTYYTAEDLTVEQVVFNYPTTVADADRTNNLLAALDAWAASGTERVTPYIGQEFNYADAKIEFLHTIDAYGIGQIDGEDFNNTSSVFTVEIAGQKIMILGDMHTIGNDQLVKLYGSYLKSDISQWAHHGLGGATRELYVEIDPSVVMNPAGVFHHTNTYNYYRYHAPADDRTAQSFKWLYYPENDETNHVKEVFLMGFKEVTLTLPYTSSPDCDYFANRNNNGYVFEEAAASTATVPNPFFELDLGEAKNVVYYKGEPYEVPSKRVEQNAAVESYTAPGLGDVLNSNSSFELFVAIDNLPNVLTGETFYMFGTSTMGLTLENNTLNVSMRKGNNTAVTTSGGRYYKGNVVGGGVVNHIVGTFDATSNTLAIYENGVLIYTAAYVDGFTAEDVLNLGSTNFNAQSGYTVLGARVYNETLTADQVAATYWAAIDALPEPCDLTLNHDKNNHWYECECGVITDVKAHTFVNGECFCGELQTNVAFINRTTGDITVRAEEGYELEAGSLIVTDANGIQYIPQRTNFREEGTATTYEVVDEGFDPTGATVAYNFIQPALTDSNIGNVGTSYNSDLKGLRFVSRFTRKVIDGTEYIVTADGEKYAITDYGMLVTSESGLMTTVADLFVTADIENAMTVNSANQYVQKHSIREREVYYDKCDDHIDMAVTVINIDKLTEKGYTLAEAYGMELYTRPYVVVTVDGTDMVLYGDVTMSTYFDNVDFVTNTATLSELREDGTLLVDGRHTITDAGNVQVSFGNAGITIAGDLAGDIYLDVKYTMYAYGQCRINVMVDGAYVDDVIAVYGDNHLKVVSDLEGGYHTIKISKGAGTPTLGNLVFEKITYSGFLKTPKVNDLQFMFLGDSITDTAGILGEDFDAPDYAGQQLPVQNIRLGYAARTSLALGADFTQVSLSANTISQTLSLFKEETWENYNGDMIPYIYGTNDTVDKDVVVINLGTNNSSNTVKDQAKMCLDAVRAKYPNAYIVWTYGMMLTPNDQLLSEAVAEWVAATGDTKTSYCSLVAVANTDGGGMHPTIEGHENAAKILTEHIANVLNIDVE